jgi:hypothetical protein
MTLVISPKKPFADYSEVEQQAILTRGQTILSQRLEQGESRSLEDTWCMLAYQRTQREVKFKPTVEKIVKEKALTKAQKVEILEQVTKMGALPLTDKQQRVVDELVGVGKEYYLFELVDKTTVLMKMTKTNIKKKLKELSLYIKEVPCEVALDKFEQSCVPEGKSISSTRIDYDATKVSEDELTFYMEQTEPETTTEVIK